MSITREQIERLNAEMPKGIHVTFGAAKVTDEMITAAVEYGRKMEERDMLLDLLRDTIPPFCFDHRSRE